MPKAGKQDETIEYTELRSKKLLQEARSKKKRRSSRNGSIDTRSPDSWIRWTKVSPSSQLKSTVIGVSTKRVYSIQKRAK